MKSEIKAEVICRVQALGEPLATMVVDDGKGFIVVYSHLNGDIIGAPCYVPKDNFLMIIKQLNNETK
jgi:thioredoxin-related protein